MAHKRRHNLQSKWCEFSNKCKPHEWVESQNRGLWPLFIDSIKEATRFACAELTRTRTVRGVDCGPFLPACPYINDSMTGNIKSGTLLGGTTSGVLTTLTYASTNINTYWKLPPYVDGGFKTNQTQLANRIALNGSLNKPEGFLNMLQLRKPLHTSLFLLLMARKAIKSYFSCSLEKR